MTRRDEFYEKAGGAAFPTAGVQGVPYFPGLTIRDYFAGQALAGMDECADAERMAHWAYKIADAMLAERDK